MARVGSKQAALGAALGMTPGAVSHRLTGRTEFSVIELVGVAKHLGVPLTALLAGVETPSEAVPA